MDIQTNYGICRNVDIDHMREYLGGIQDDTACFIFTNAILQVDEDEYLIFGFEVWRGEKDKFKFFVEEGFHGGEAQTYDAGISRAAQEYIKKLYYTYIQNKSTYKYEEDPIGGYTIYNELDEIIMWTDSKEDAEYYVKTYSVKPPKKHISPYQQFDNYTKNLKGKCYIHGKIATPFETPLTRFAKSFETKMGYKIEIDAQYLGGEWIYIVDSVE